jgi:hypothetical protein
MVYETYFPYDQAGKCRAESGPLKFLCENRPVFQSVTKAPSDFFSKNPCLLLPIDLPLHLLW